MKPLCLDAALDYLRRGWSAFPLCPPNHVGVGKEHAKECKNPGKVPLTNWKQYQTRLPMEGHLQLLFRRHPNANVGVALGQVSGLVGIDVDGPAEHELLQEISGGDLPPTMLFSTGKGYRLLYSWPKDRPCKSTTLVKDGVQLLILGDGKQTVMPPSLHASGSPYQWQDDNPLQPAPAWLVQQVENAAEPRRPGQAGCVAAGEVIPQGQRDRTLTRMAGAMRRQGASAEELFVALTAINQRCDPPLLDADLRRIANSVARYPPHQINVQTMAQAAKAATPRPPASAKTVPLHTVTAREVLWLWLNWLPLGKLAVLDGDPGLGKSTLLLDLAARVSRDGIMPDGSQGATGAVVILSSEDAVEDTIKPRLEAAGAELTKIEFLDEVIDQDGARPPVLPLDIPLIEAVILRLKAKLLIIDPLMAYLGAVDAIKDQDIRRALHRLKKLAEKQQCTIVYLRHLNKGTGTKAIYRGGGSIGIIGAARAGMLVAQDPDSSFHRILACTKSNLAAKPPSLRYVLDPTDSSGVCRIGWWKRAAARRARHRERAPPAGSLARSLA
jgi:hypothetical protein